MAFERIAEQRINEAVEAGEFSNLPNAGEPLDLDSYFALPGHLRMAYSVLKSANCVPQEVELLNEVARLEAALANEGGASDAATHARLGADLQSARLRLAVALERLKADSRRGR